jgi:hypothetical protein
MGRTESEQTQHRATEAEVIAGSMQQDLFENGVDVKVSFDEHYHKILFDRNAPTDLPEKLKAKLTKQDRRNWCRMGIWRFAVPAERCHGFSGCLESPGGTEYQASLGCSEEQEACLSETQAERNEYAASHNAALEEVKIRAHAEDRVLVFESDNPDLDFDKPVVRARLLTDVLQQNEEEKQLCPRGFTRVLIKGRNQAKALPLTCTPRACPLGPPYPY